MKAKEEYVDAPRETRSKDITVYAVIFLVLLVGAGIFLAVKLLHKPADAALADSKSGIVYDSSAVEGGWDNLSPEEIAERLNQKVEEGMINISMNTAPYFENGTAEGNLMLVNESINNYPQKVQIVRNDTGEQIYEAGCCSPRWYIRMYRVFSQLGPRNRRYYRHGWGNYHNHNSTLILIKGVITMKNTKKIVSLILAICMIASLAISASAANTVDASGGTGTSSVTLSSTADGSLDGDPSATKMSVVVPTVLPIAVGTDGSVATASDAKIINNSYGAVKVNSVSIEAAQGWSLAAFGSKDTLAHEKVNSNKFGFQLAIGGGAAAATDNKNASKQTLLDAAAEGCYMSGVGDTSANSIGIAYDAIVTPVSEAVTNTAIASVLFIIAWDAV